ncbi:aspartate--tRNA ligase [Candidatus Contubernalis alkaliaceticus]|uniref:aspartate--tRNA ligase n=1 Tax=Candidatus Contubernalis alkaliaceticus TaxID=338645 RepID=UPI001F4C24EA|nr:aspartate--tRNA ligase [Candidatus Contubernalis alkalaceticus]UNC92888.1 aspartate--tRNA ligase [Candidatus Contubernalis alkalaceticus]
MKKTHDCGTLRLTNVGDSVSLSGWIQVRRDHGGVIFVDLRDRTGIAQVVFDCERNKEIFQLAQTLRSEFVISIVGEVTARSQETVNPKIPTGEVEVFTEELEILNVSKTPPIYVEDDKDVDENLRLKYRYLDLRRPEMQKKLFMRHNIIKKIRDYLDDKGFWEVETPVLTRSTPEGARDYLVPSRMKPGSFYALPQSPQLFKQLLMVAGMEKYFQIVRCFRDEDLRADRQPEFTQLDMEMSFVDTEDILAYIEGLVQHIYREVLGVELTLPFPRMSYGEAMERYGSDKPDLRFGLEIKEVSDLVSDSQFKVFTGAIKKGGIVRGINAKGAAFSRKDVDDLTEFCIRLGAKGLAWFMVGPEGLKSPLLKFFTSERLEQLSQRMEAQEGDVLLFVADVKEKAEEILGHLRNQLGHKMDLIKGGENNFLWLIDFPLLTYDPEEKRYVANHHPFTSPREEDIKLMDSEPEKIRAQAYDLVLNGLEVGGGSIRIHRREMQEKMFELLGFSNDEAYEQFGFLLQAFEYGTPPHGGIALGLDRLIMLMLGASSIREVIPFPKTAGGSCLLTDAPAPVEEKQLEDLHIGLKLPEGGA